MQLHFLFLWLSFFEVFSKKRNDLLNVSPNSGGRQVRVQNFSLFIRVSPKSFKH